MPDAIKAKSLPAWRESVDKHAAKGNARKSFKSKKFSQLNNNDKDNLLKAMAIQLGFIEE